MWASSLRLCFVQNDIIPKLLSRRKEVTKKGRPLVIGYSCLSLRSPTGAAELAPLKQSSPYFRLLPRSRQPDKGGHFSSPTLPAIKGKGGSLLSFRARAIARRGIPCFYSQHSNCTLAWWEILRCSIPLNDIIQAKDYNTLHEILSPCGRQNDKYLVRDFFIPLARHSEW